MAVIITSTTDTPEAVASAMGAEVEKEGAEVETKTTTPNPESPEITHTPDATPDAKPKTTEGEPKKDEADEKEVEEEFTEAESKSDDQSDDDSDDDEPAQPKKKVTGYKKKAMRLEEENRLLLDLLKKEGVHRLNAEQSSAESENEPETEDDGPKTYSGKAKPKLADFQDQPDPYAAFSEAVSDWAVEEASAKIRFEQNEAARENAQNLDKKNFNDRLATVNKEGGIYEDYDEVLESIRGKDLKVSGLMRSLIMRAKAKDGTPISVDVMHYLASNPEECNRIFDLPPEEQAAEMGIVRMHALAETDRRTAALAEKGKSKGKPKSEAKSETKVESDGTKPGAVPPKPKAKTPPPPISPVGKRSAPASQDLETIAASGDFKAYEAQRIAQGRKYR